jgi:hypothetical protein
VSRATSQAFGRTPAHSRRRFVSRAERLETVRVAPRLREQEASCRDRQAGSPERQRRAQSRASMVPLQGTTKERGAIAL